MAGDVEGGFYLRNLSAPEAKPEADLRADSGEGTELPARKKEIARLQETAEKADGPDAVELAGKAKRAGARNDRDERWG